MALFTTLRALILLKT